MNYIHSYGIHENAHEWCWFFLIEKKVIYLLVDPQLYQTVDVGYFLFAFHEIKIRPLLNCAVVSLRALVGSIKLSALDFIIFTKRSNSWKYKPQFLSKEGLVTLTRKFHAIKKENIIDLKKPACCMKQPRRYHLSGISLCKNQRIRFVTDVNICNC